jgi:hypothetical protein
MSRWFKNPQTAIWQILTAVVVVLGLGGAIALGIFVATSNADLRAQLAEARGDTRAQTANAEKLYEQVQELGAKPKAQKPSAVQGEPGKPGDQGPKGDKGDSGTSITAVSCSTSGQWSVYFSDGDQQTLTGPCVGQTGPQGVPGANGADSTVPGPVGPTGAAGANGADSTVPGPVGPMGPPGAAGEPPLSWTYVTTSPLGGSKTHTCTRADPFDPAAPTYTCD